MKLLTFAHYLEAQNIIQEFSFKEVTQDLFKSDEMLLLITGEGPFEASTKTALILGEYPVTEVINLGIAGSLDKNIQKEEVVDVRCFYLSHDNKPFFKSFPSGINGVDCVTSFERILTQEKATPLMGLSKIVDREGWGIAMACKTKGIPFRAIKVISDEAGTLGACELIKSHAGHFSELLLQALQKVLNLKPQLKEEFNIPGLYFTFSMKHRFNDLLTKISIKDEASQDEVIKTLPIDEILILEKSPKEKALQVIELMEKRLDPLKGMLKEKRNSLIKEFADKGIKLELDTSWENPSARIIFDAKNDYELKDNLERLKSLSLKDFTSLMNGEFHVE